MLNLVGTFSAVSLGCKRARIITLFANWLLALKADISSADCRMVGTNLLRCHNNQPLKTLTVDRKGSLGHQASPVKYLNALNEWPI